MLDYLWVALGIVLILVGLIGCIVPVLPGPPLSFLGLLFLQFSRFGDFSVTFLLVMAFVALAVTVLDYVVPMWGTKKTGGTKAGVWGAALGMLVGIFFFPPLGIILGPLVGAIVGEAIRGASLNQSFRAGLGSLLGFMLGTGLKLIASMVMTFYFFKELF
jgi:uncharacterized protein YqgC (DUF456 family)